MVSTTKTIAEEKKTFEPIWINFEVPFRCMVWKQCVAPHWFNYYNQQLRSTIKN